MVIALLADDSDSDEWHSAEQESESEDEIPARSRKVPTRSVPNIQAYEESASQFGVEEDVEDGDDDDDEAMEDEYVS